MYVWNSYSPSAPQHEDGFSVFFARQFVENLLDHSLGNYEKWRNIEANRLNMRTREFRFRLIDYEQIVPSVLRQHPESYLADTWVVCDVLSYHNLVFNASNSSLSLDFKWSCKASLEISSGSVYTFLGKNLPR